MMRKLAILGLLIGCVSGCDDSSSELEMGLPVTQSDMKEVFEQTKAPGSETAQPLPKPSETGPWPSVVVENTTFEFGRMQVGTYLQHKFTIRNEGEADLNLLAGKSTCKCTKFVVESTTLKPGEETVLSIEWKGEFVDKNFQHGGPVYTDDPKRAEINFSVSGQVDAPFKVLPENDWQLGPFVENQPATIQAVICSSLFDEFTITKIECDSPYVSATTEPLSSKDLTAVEAICGYYVNVAVSTDMPPGYLQETLRVSVDKGEDFNMDIKISATREGPIKVVSADGGIWVASQNGLKLGQFQKGAGREAVLTLSVAADEMEDTLEIISSEVSPKFLGVSLEHAPSASKTINRYLLKVRVPPGIPKTQKSSENPATIVLKTNHPLAPEFRFNMTFSAF